MRALDDAAGDAPNEVSSARDFVRGLTGLGVAFVLLLAAGGLSPEGPRFLQLAAMAVGAAAVYLLTRQPRGARRNRLRWWVRGLGVAFVLAEVVELRPAWLEVFDVVLQAPFLLATGALGFAHVRPEAALYRRLQTDMALVVVVVASLWALKLLGAHPHAASRLPGETLYAVAVMTSVVAGLVVAARLPDTLQAMMASGLSPAWRTRAAADGWEVHTDRAACFAASARLAGHRLEVWIERDPVPPRTRMRIGFPELAGVSVYRRGTEPEGHGPPSPLGDEVLDAAFVVHGEAARLAAAIRRDRATWSRILQQWPASLQDGVLSVSFEGSKPRPRWIRGGPALSEEDVLDHLLGDLDRLSRAVRDAG